MLYGLPDITETHSRFDQSESLVKTFLRDFYESLCVGRDLSHGHHDTCIAMPPILDYGYIDIDDVALL